MKVEERLSTLLSLLKCPTKFGFLECPDISACSYKDDRFCFEIIIHVTFSNILIVLVRLTRKNSNLCPHFPKFLVKWTRVYKSQLITKLSVFYWGLQLNNNFKIYGDIICFYHVFLEFAYFQSLGEISIWPINTVSCAEHLIIFYFL